MYVFSSTLVCFIHTVQICFKQFCSNGKINNTVYKCHFVLWPSLGHREYEMNFLVPVYKQSITYTNRYGTWRLNLRKLHGLFLAFCIHHYTGCLQVTDSSLQTDWLIPWVYREWLDTDSKQHSMLCLLSNGIV